MRAQIGEERLNRLGELLEQPRVRRHFISMVIVTAVLCVKDTRTEG